MVKRFLLVKEVIITGKFGERKKMFDWCDRNSYSVDRCGPHVTKNLRADTSRYEVVAHTALIRWEERQVAVIKG